MSFWKLRVVVTLNQLLAIIASALVTLNLAPAAAGQSFELFATPEGVLFAQGSLALLWIVQLWLLWNPSEFTSNKNLFRPSSIGKSSAIVLIAVGILAGVEESLAFFGYGVLFVSLGAVFLLTSYIIQRHFLREAKHSSWLPARSVILVDKKQKLSLLGEKETYVPQIELDDSQVDTLIARFRPNGERLPQPGESVDLRQTLKDMRVSAAFLSGRNKWRSETAGAVISENQGEGVDSIVLTQLGPEAAEKVDILLLENDTAILIRSPRRKKGYLAFKRLFDVVVATLLLLVLSPLMLAVAVIIRSESEGPAFFHSERLGKSGKPFTIYKFRSMRNGASHDHEKRYLERTEYRNGVLFKEPNDDRITRFGGFMRRTSIDELPQLWNVVKGDMSLVGPRPHMALEMADLPARELRRLNVKPGITGLWQVNGRSDLAWDEAVKLDLLYVSNQSLWLDLTILLRTIPAVLSARGAF